MEDCLTELRQTFAIAERQTAEVSVVAERTLATRTPTQATVTPRAVAESTETTPAAEGPTDDARPRHRRVLDAGIGVGAAIVLTVVVVVVAAGGRNTSPFEGTFNPGRLEF